MHRVDRTAPAWTALLRRQRRHQDRPSAMWPSRINKMDKQMLSLSAPLLVGLLVGLLAKRVGPASASLGWVMMGLVGITGAFMANYLGVAMQWYGPSEPAGWFASAVGAVVLAGIASVPPPGR